MMIQLVFMTAALSLAEPYPQQEPVRTGIVENVVTVGPPALFVYPVAGALGTDFTIPYYVDLQEGAGIRDFNCGGQTFEGHTGHDVYLRTFSEQRIGVPVFAVLDGTVTEVREDQPDENTDNSSNAESNFVTVRHENGMVSQYVHLRRDSVPVNVGDFVSAGTQIGLVGSSGASLAPHIHFEFRFEGEVVEPMAGPCRPGYSFFRDQPPANAGFTFIRGTLSRTSFGAVRPSPHDDAPPTGMFRRGLQTFYYKADVANVSSSTEYELYLERPNGTRVPMASGALLTRSAALAAVWWELTVDLNATGTWHIVLEIEGGEEFRRPFTVVSSSTPLTNRAPNPISASIAPFTLGEVPVCRVSGDPLADPDYDVVAYRYQWHVGGTLVRDVTSAATTDALARNLVTNRSVACTVTASDGFFTTQPAMAFAEAGLAKRRAVRSR